MHARMYDICAYYKVKFADLVKGGLHMLSRAGEDAVMAAPNRDGKVVPTQFFQQILEAAGDIKPKMIAIASSANVFAGNEISRTQVMQFAGLLTKLAITANGSVALASHPSLTGIKDGTGLSGSTQWHNAFRARAYLNFIKPEKDEQPDPDLRELQFLKNQYGRRDDTILLRYQNGLFLPAPSANPVTQAAKGATADDVFLALLRRFTALNRRVSSQPSVTYAPLP
jgi:RecA-family ATPase